MTSPIGTSIRRQEDRRFLTGRGRYLDDIRIADVLHAAFVRSPHAHARIGRVHVEAARALPGVVAVLTTADLPRCGEHAPAHAAAPAGPRPWQHPSLAGPGVRHIGETVAVVVADDPYRAADGAEAVRVEYEVLPVAATVPAALAAGAPRVFAAWPDNRLSAPTSSVGDVAKGFAQAEVTVEIEVSFPRVSPAPIEPRGALAVPQSPDGVFTMWTSTQVPYSVRGALASVLALSEARIRVMAPDVGGGFGGKGHVYPEELVVAAVAQHLGRPVKWVESRREHLLVSSSDRDQHHRARLGVRHDGTIVGLETTFVRDHGAYPVLGDIITLNTINHFPGPYRVPHYRATGVNVVSHKPFTGAYRGAGRPEAALVLDRLLDRAARSLGLDPAELRRRNLVRKDEMPYRTGLTYRDGAPIVYDPADYPAALELVLARLDYGQWREEQKRRQGTDRPIGIGLSAYVEGTGIGPFEGADVRVDAQGTVHVFVGVSCQGQAHETTLAQIAAAELGLDPTEVVVVGGDTTVLGFGMGTVASRVAAVAGPAVARSARDVGRKAKLVASELLECAPDDIVLAGRQVHVAGAPDRALPLALLAQAAVRSPALAREGAPGLHACAYFHPGTVTWAFGAHACVVEVDVETGRIRLLAYAAAHDCGRPINPMVVEGQLHGGIVQGIGTALSEELVYDERGQLLTGSLMEYGLPRADELPSLEVVPLNYPSVINELGIKGVGESGIISPPPAIANAVEDALADRGADILRVPLTAARIWAAIHQGGRPC
jgi:aerobic carbon-monoxide dehydrogenase large subunit